MQFHPEVESTPDGIRMIHNFLYNVCGATGDYSLRNLEGKLIEQVRQQVGDSEVLLGLSGGVDSSVCAALLSKAIPGKLHCIFVDHGLMRKNEGDEVEEAFQRQRPGFYQSQRRGAIPCGAERRDRSGRKTENYRRGICQGF